MDSENLNDLLPFISNLISITELQEILQSKLDILVAKESMEMRTAYLQTSSITEILPDDILVKCIKYLEAFHFTYLPVLSKTMHAIMTEHANIYGNVCKLM